MIEAADRPAQLSHRDWWLSLPCGHFLPVSTDTPVAALTPSILDHERTCTPDDPSGASSEPIVSANRGRNP